MTVHLTNVAQRRATIELTEMLDNEVCDYCNAYGLTPYQMRAVIKDALKAVLNGLPTEEDQ